MAKTALLMVVGLVLAGLIDARVLTGRPACSKVDSVSNLHDTGMQLDKASTTVQRHSSTSLKTAVHGVSAA